jgi:hypothetical protein
MSTFEEDNRKYIILKNRLTVLLAFEGELAFSTAEKQEIIDNILDNMIVLLKRIRSYDEYKKDK